MGAASRLRAALDPARAGWRPGFGRPGEQHAPASRMPFGGGLLAGPWQYWLLAGWLTLAFLLGGSARGDVLSLVVLRPVSVLVLAAALTGLTGAPLRENRLILSVAAAWLALPALQLVPLPPAIWQALPGRAIITRIDHAAGLGDVWRPFSMAPGATWNAFWALLGPAAALVLALQLGLRDHLRLLTWLIALGFAGAALGILQMLGDAQGPLYFYRYTNPGLPVGLMANRNHQAALLAMLLPMLFVWAKMRAAQGGGTAWRALLACAGATIAAPLVLLTGSRSGTVLCLVALGLVPLLLAIGGRAGGQDGRLRLRLPLLGLLCLATLLALLGLAILLGRAPSLDRLAGLTPSQDMRVLILPALLRMMHAYAPWGTGLGTFDPVFRIHEPDVLLGPTYMNHVHDDWLEIVLEGGIPALALLALALAGIGWRCLALLRESRGKQDSQIRLFGWLGLALLMLLGLASITDYPLRVPSLACLAAVAAVWTRLRPAEDRREG